MYKRILLKLSGEALKDESNQLILDSIQVNHIAQVIKDLHDNGVEIAIVIGAGNIWRGKLADMIGIVPAHADYMGMLGTVINAVALASAVNNLGVGVKTYSAVSPIEEVADAYSIEEADKALSQGKVVFLAGGTGKPYCTTDTAAALRALELNCEAILMGKNGVDGIYTGDPDTDPDAKFIKDITYNEILKRKLRVMDLSAVQLIKESNISIRVFSMEDPHNFIRVVNGEDLGTTVQKGE